MAFTDPSSREAAAVAEMAATRFGRGVASALVTGFLVLLALGPLLELDAFRRGTSSVLAPLPAAAASRGWLAGARAEIDEIETRFDERSALVRAVRPSAQLALTRLLGYGNERVVLGERGWLFFRDDIGHLLDRSRSGSGDPVAVLEDFRDQLASRGIALVVLPVPVKPAIQPERLGASRALAPLRRSGEKELLARLDAAGVEVVDLASRFARDAALSPLYLATDTHWRPEAVEIAAREIALRLRTASDLPPGDDEEFREEVLTINGEGDLVRMLGLPSGPMEPARESVEVRRVQRIGTAPARAPVLLLGDSFAEVYSGSLWGRDAGLADRLAFLLGLPVDRLTELAGGASASRRKLAAEIARDPHRLDGVRAVVLEIVTREISQGDWTPIALSGNS